MQTADQQIGHQQTGAGEDHEERPELNDHLKEDVRQKEERHCEPRNCI